MKNKVKVLFSFFIMLSVLSIVIDAFPAAFTFQSQSAGSGVTGTWLSILPPLIAIAAALIFKQVLLALFLGIWLGVFLLGPMDIVAVFSSFFGVITQYIVPATADEGHMSIIIFSLLIGGIVGIITANGGTRGIIRLMNRFVNTKIRGQLATSALGFIVFFDDYANTMVVGNTMRPLTDKLRISRAKLAYLVDSTAAPVATIALVSTWIGAMVGYIGDAEAGMANYNESAYLVFLNSLPYNFYAFFTIFFVLLIAWSGRDFGPMLDKRIRLYKAKNKPELDRYNVYKENVKNDDLEKKESHWANAAVPILVLVFGTIAGLFVTGSGENVQDIIASADSYAALLWGSLGGLVVAFVMTIGQSILDTEKTLEEMMKGMHTLYEGTLILVMAWALSAITTDLGTADFLISIFSDSLDPLIMPALIFILSAFTSFATGSSWGTMGILMPLVIPLVWSMGNSAVMVNVETTQILIYASVSSVLAGSVWGDHCSPISDTTILSSIATQCDHIEHVNTQLPYAMVGGVISLAAIVISIYFNIPWWVIYPTGFALMVGIVYIFGENPEHDEFKNGSLSD